MDCEKTYTLTNREKWTLCVLLALVAIVCFLPAAFRMSDQTGRMVKMKTLSRGRPTPLGIVLHMSIFIVIIRVILK